MLSNRRVDESIASDRSWYGWAPTAALILVLSDVHDEWLAILDFHMPNAFGPWIYGEKNKFIISTSNSDDLK